MKMENMERNGHIEIELSTDVEAEMSYYTIGGYIVNVTKVLCNQLTDGTKLALILFVPFWLGSVHAILKMIV
jgi:hypothetical protein